MALSIEEFLKLPDDEKGEKFKLMSNHDKFLWRTQYEPLGTPKVIGYREITPEEKEEARLALLEILKKRGVKPPEDLLKPINRNKADE